MDRSGDGERGTERKTKALMQYLLQTCIVVTMATLAGAMSGFVQLNCENLCVRECVFKFVRVCVYFVCGRVSAQN